ncbi:MAG: hypothetical protein J2P28_14020, partial [Actinobacteria bacterium]|nr:hypothetical protein [Actinomycetota bacterium]
LAQVGGAAGVQAVRQINLRNGAVRVLRPTPGSAFPGALSAVVDGVLLFSQAGGVVAYGSKAGAPLWKRDSSVLELTDPGLGVAYLASGNALDGVDVDSGAVVSKTGLSVAGGLYWVAAGVAVGLDENALGAAWGYDLGSHRVLWTSAALPWPHFFTDMSGLGGSMSEGSTIVLLAVCAKVGGNYVGAPGPACLRPELAAVLV